MTATTTLTAQDIEAGYDDARWCGWGYLQGRHYEDAAEVAKADQYVLGMAARQGWDAEDLFHWANSKDGRWFGDWFFGSGPVRVEYPWVKRLFPKVPAR